MSTAKYPADRNRYFFLFIFVCFVFVEKRGGQSGEHWTHALPLPLLRFLFWNNSVTAHGFAMAVLRANDTEGIIIAATDLSEMSEILFVGQQDDRDSTPDRSCWIFYVVLLTDAAMVLDDLEGSLLGRTVTRLHQADEGFLCWPEGRPIRNRVDDNAGVAVFSPVGRNGRVLLVYYVNNVG